jgi:ligand-binding sensor domain-containing protein
VAAACRGTPTTALPAQFAEETASPVSSTALPVQTQELVPSPQATALLPSASIPSASDTPDPRTDPAGALLYSNFPTGLGDVGFTATYDLRAEPQENFDYGLETARSFGTLNVVDYTTGAIDMEAHVSFSISTFGQDIHVIKTGDQAWARAAAMQWQALPADALTSSDWERMVWGGWHPLNALEPFDSAVEVTWVEDMLLDGELVHHLHVVFDPDKMRHLSDTAKARYEYQWVSLLDDPGLFGDATSVDVQAEVWLAADDLAAKQVDMRIMITSTEDASSSNETIWTITRTIRFDADAANAIVEPIFDADGTPTDCGKVTEIPEAECGALVALYQSTGGETWDEVDGWLVGDQPCSWGGVTCRDGHVVWLFLPQAGLTGALPLELGNLRWLQVFHLSHNDVTAPLPRELGALADLQALDLSWNSALAGTLPDEFGNLHSLRELNLGLSGLRGPLPEGLTNTKLTYLDLDGTRLCVPDDPRFRAWVTSIDDLGLGTQYAGVESIYCKPQPGEPVGTPCTAAVPAIHADWSSITNANFVSDMAFDKSGALWAVGSGGAVRWDPEATACVKYTVDQGLASNELNAVAVGPDGALWIGSEGGGASRLDGAGWITYTQADGLASNKVRAIAVAPDGEVWLGTDRGASRFDGETWTTYTTADGLASDSVGSIAIAPDGAVWLGTVGAGWQSPAGLGASRFDGQTWKTYTMADGLAGDKVNAITVALDGALWFGTDGGASRLDDEVWTTYTTLQGLAGNDVYAIAAAPDGVLWFGTGSGASSFGGEVWTTYTTADGLADKTVEAVAVAPDGAAWFGTPGGGLSRFDGQTWITHRTADGLVANGISSIAVAADGAMWIGAAGDGGGVSRLDGETWTTYTKADGLASENVSAVAIAPDDAVWFGTYESGVSRFDEEVWERHLRGLLVWDIAVAPDDTLWFGTIMGAYRFDGQEWMVYDEADGMASDNVSAVAIAADGVLWFVTDGGVSSYDDGVWTTYTKDDGLVSGRVWDVEVAPDGVLWFGGDGGVSRFDGRAWTTYTADDGLASNGVNTIAVTPDGVLWFGTDSGASRFDGETWTTYNTVDGLADNQVSAIVLGPDGIVWFATNGGVARYATTR